jgi:hypothetical protein
VLEDLAVDAAQAVLQPLDVAQEHIKEAEAMEGIHI